MKLRLALLVLLSALAFGSVAGAAEAAGGISGKVTAKTGGAALAQVLVSVEETTANQGYSAYTAADGSYAFDDLPAGSYQVSFYPTQGNYAYEYYDDTHDYASATPVRVDGNPVGDVDAQLSTGGTISGTLTDSDHKPLQGINVSAYGDGGGYGSATTDATGHYEVSQLAPDDYRVAFSGTGVLFEYYDDTPSYDKAKLVPVAEAQAVPGIDASLAHDATISGTVLDGAGKPVSNASVFASSASDGSGAATTRSDGSYKITGLRGGTYTVRFQAPSSSLLLDEYYDDSPSSTGAKPVKVDAGGDQTQIDAVLEKAGHISGHVTRSDNASAVGTNVNASSLIPGVPGKGVQVDANGDYDIGGLRPGSWHICFSPPAGDTAVVRECYDDEEYGQGDAVTVESGKTTPNIDAQLTNGGRVLGTVTRAGGTAVAGVTVSLLRYGSVVTTDTTDAAGAYVLTAPGSGDYQVRFAPGSGSGLLSEQSDTVTVHRGQDSTANAELDPAGSITGTVTGAGAGGLEGATVYAYGTEEDQQGATAQTDADGHYTLEGLRSGTYIVSYRAPDGSAFLDGYYENATTYEDAKAVTVTAGATTPEINTQLGRGGTVTGRVTDADGRPVAATTVTVSDDRTGLYRQAQTNSDGVYEVTGLPTRAATLVNFQPSGDSDLAPEYYDDRATYVKANRVPVTAGQATEHIDAVLEQSGAISGTVTGAGADALRNIWVDVYDAASRAQVGSTRTSKTGTYKIGDLKPGKYKVQFEGKDLYLGEYYENARGLASATKVTVGAGTTTAAIDAELDVGGVITGTVKDVTGSPVPGRYVHAGNAYAYTDANGTYRLEGLNPGSYAATVGGDDAFVEQAHASVAVTANGVVEKIDFTLTAKGGVSGKVVDDQGHPQEGSIIALDADDNQVTGASVQSDGTFTIKLPEGSYRLRVDPNDRTFLPKATEAIPVTAGEVTPAPTIVLGRSGRIAGVVTGPDGAVRGATVTAYDAAGNEAGSVQTEADGTYRVIGLQTGQYRLRASTDSLGTEYWDGKASLDAATPVAVTAPNGKGGVDFALGASATVEGTVSGSANKPLPYVYVTAYDASGTPQRLASTSTDKQGHYSLSGLTTGSYRIRFALDRHDGPPAYTDEWYDDQPTAATATLVPVVSGETKAGVDAQLAPAPVLSGTLTDVDDAPVNGAQVTIYDAAGEKVLTTYTQDDGTYETRLSPGTYRVGFEADDFDPQFFDHHSTLAKATPITLAAGETKVADAVLSVLGSPDPDASGSSATPAETVTATATATATATGTATPPPSATASPSPRPTAKAVYAGKRHLAVRHGRLRLRVACGQRGCAVNLFAKVGPKHRKRLIAAAIAGSGGGRVTLKLTRTGRRRIARHPAKATLMVQQLRFGAVTTYALTLDRG